MRTLPTRVAIGDGEALDSYLERVAVANDLSTRDLFRLLTEAHDTVRPPAGIHDDEAGCGTSKSAAATVRAYIG